MPGENCTSRSTSLSGRASFRSTSQTGANRATPSARMSASASIRRAVVRSRQRRRFHRAQCTAVHVENQPIDREAYHFGALIGTCRLGLRENGAQRPQLCDAIRKRFTSRTPDDVSANHARPACAAARRRRGGSCGLGGVHSDQRGSRQNGPTQSRAISKRSRGGAPPDRRNRSRVPPRAPDRPRSRRAWGGLPRPGHAESTFAARMSATARDQPKTTQDNSAAGARPRRGG